MSYECTLSANTLFHFTNSSDNLESILKNEFHPRYCLENWDVIFPEVKELQEIAIPMVSFCDIPLSQIKNHVKYYGKYAIGLTKEWGIKNNICPVLYTYKQSELSAHLKRILAGTLSSGIEAFKNNNFKNIFYEWFKLIKYLKPYEGVLWRDGNYHNGKIKFYDEREWRFCPNIPTSDKSQLDKPTSFLAKETFLKPDSAKNANIILEQYKLSFDPKDIKYIIVDRENEILGMVNKIIQIKQNKYTHADLQILTTRIISMEHIFEDF